MEEPQRRSRPQAIARYGRYEALFKIAAGGMAEVYAARMVGEGGFEKMVALKRMLPTLAEDEKFVAMFLDEGRLAANIASPNVVQTLDLGRADDDSLFLVMELVVGVSLSGLMKKLVSERTPVPVPIAAEILAQAAQGLHDAHEARTVYGEPLGIVHRDVSPQNVLIDVTGRARITDFGVARALQRMTNTQTGEVKGKLAYFAPEQARAKPLDRRSDVFAIGIVAWETLSGKRLFAGDNPAEVLMKLVELPIPRLDHLRPEVPAALADAVAGALERDPAKRTPTAAELARQIRAACACASTSEVGEFVRRHGGESLTSLEAGLRSCVSSSPSFRALGGGARAEPGSGVISVARDDAATLVTPSGAMIPELVAPQLAEPPRVEASSTGAVPATPARGLSLPAVAGIVLVVAAVAAGIAWGLASGGDPAPATVAAPPASIAPAAEPAAAEPGTDTREDSEPAPVAAPEPAADAREARTERRRPGRPTRAGREQAPAPAGTAPEPVAARPAEPPRSPEPAPPRAAEPAPPRAAEPAPPRAVEPVARPAEPPPPRPQPVARPAPPPEPAPSPRPARGLRGLDDFERDLGH